MKRKILFLAAVAIMFIAALATSAQFAGGLGTLAGNVLNEDGKPVADASVTIQTSDGLNPHATHTDSSGHFEFTRFEAGQYDVRAYSNKVFSEWAKRVVIRPKKTTEITLRISATAK